ncbi:MAG: hypothetical protein Q4G43_05980 [Mobilicoccus sp.]|nr:hypothetical protein [Mobilicoccus sp.]
MTQTETQTETATETVEPSPAPDDETASPDAEAWTMLTAVRAGQHEGFDRIVIDVDGPDVPPWETEYVEEVLDPKGESWTVRGEALLRILVHAPARDTDWNPTVPPAQEAVDVAGFESLRQVAFVGEHHGTATFAVGVDEARPVTTDMVSDGTHHRLVVDVPHA